MNSAPLQVAGDAGTAALAGPAPGDALPLDPALAVQAGLPAALPFLQFMRLDGAAVPADALPLPEPADTAQASFAALPEGEEASEAAAGDTLAAAMAMPLMPSMMMAMPAALPMAVRMAAGMPEQPRAAETAAVATVVAAAPAADAAAADGVELPPAGAVRGTPEAVLPAQAAEAMDAQPARTSVAVAMPAAPAPAANAAAPAAPAAPATLAAAPAGDATAASDNGAGTGTNAGFGVAAPSAPNAAAREGGTLALSGPPTAWRQSLQEALGERLNLQLGKNVEQATIRLEPPMLGRVEISIRHVAGSLEVNITATHGEVLRQLNSVSDNLRNDLAGRQYTDVSVNVSQAPRAQSVAQAGANPGAGFGADAQGRGRQQGQEQDERAPGAALAEAHHSNSAFSLNGRA